jgi:hypothetical protein
MLKCLLPISPEHAKTLKQQGETGPGYHVVSVELTDGRFFEQVVVSPSASAANASGFLSLGSREPVTLPDRGSSFRFVQFREHASPQGS